MEENRLDRPNDNLTEINGIGPKFAEALFHIGIVSYAQLAQHTAVSLSQLLIEEAGLKVSAERINRNNWLGQARQLAGSPEHHTGITDQPKSESDTELAKSAAWRQHAGFSLFFDYEEDSQGKHNLQTRIRQTHVYHDESGEQVELAGWEPDKWAGWIVQKAQLPVKVAQGTAPALSEAQELLEWPEARLEILHVEVSEMAPSMALPEKHLCAEVHFKLSGLDMSRLVAQAEARSLRLDVQAIDLETGKTDVIESSKLLLEDNVYEYVGRLELPLPKIGNYQLHHDLSLNLPAGAMKAHFEGPELQVIP